MKVCQMAWYLNWQNSQISKKRNSIWWLKNIICITNGPAYQILFYLGILFHFISFYFLFSNNYLHTVHNLPSRRAAQTNWTIILGVETLPLKLFFSSTICKGQLCDLYYKLEYIHPEIGWKILSSSIYCTIWSFYIHIL